jgi:hypothetical protein
VGSGDDRRDTPHHQLALAGTVVGSRSHRRWTSRVGPALASLPTPVIADTVRPATSRSTLWNDHCGFALKIGGSGEPRRTSCST